MGSETNNRNHAKFLDEANQSSKIYNKGSVESQKVIEEQSSSLQEIKIELSQPLNCGDEIAQ